MAKGKATAFFCKECGHESAKWTGQCPACREWNTMVEEPADKRESSSRQRRGPVLPVPTPTRLSDVILEDDERTATGFDELDRVLGGGVVTGSLVLVGGDPGIGKSTLLLQVCRNLAASGKQVLYISGEESLKQIKMRAARIGEVIGDLLFLCETSLESIQSVIEKTLPQIVIIDSIQTMYREEISSAPGSVSQVRETTSALMQIAKGMGITIFIVGHVTKEGVVAGPRVLEHMVDTVLYFEGERNASYRIIRGVKNRFGSTNEIGVFEMQERGLAEVKNPSEYMLSGRPQEASGAVVACSLEGTRPILLEVQALVAATNFGMPRRTTAGTDYNRVNLLMAVMEKRCRFDMSHFDAYINIAGGMKMNEPALDLAIVMALASSYKDKPVDPGVIIFGEVGLSGEVRAVSMAQQRVQEAVKLGFHTCIMPMVSLDRLMGEHGSAFKNIKLIGAGNLAEALQQL